MDYMGFAGTEEMFREIPACPPYQISSWGRVVNGKSGKPASIWHNNNGYLVFRYTRDGKTSHLKLHRLVAEAFVPNPEGKTDVMHIDGNKRNNSYTNLRWADKKENMIAHAEAMRRKRQAELSL